MHGGYMQFVLILLGVFLSHSIHATTSYETQIHHVDLGQQMGDEALIFLSNGKVATLRSYDPELIQKFQTAKAFGSWLKVTLSDEQEVIDVEKARAPFKVTLGTAAVNKSLQTEYVPSVLPSMAVAKDFFFDTKYNDKDSQCYMRAHVWAYDWRTKRDLYSSKVWLFFSRKYIRKHKFGWWFHIAPYVHVVDEGKVRERVMDRKYFPHRGPVKVKQWTDFFIQDKSDCPVVTKYSDHANYPESGSCFLMKSSMYYYQPVDLEQMETKGVVRNNWIEAEVKQAFFDAFDVTL